MSSYNIFILYWLSGMAITHYVFKQLREQDKDFQWQMDRAEMIFGPALPTLFIVTIAGLVAIPLAVLSIFSKRK